MKPIITLPSELTEKLRTHSLKLIPLADWVHATLIDQEGRTIGAKGKDAIEALENLEEQIHANNAKNQRG